MKQSLLPFGSFLLSFGQELLFPTCCAACGVYAEGIWLCQRCRGGLVKINKKRCLQCGVSHGSRTVEICPLCENLPYPFHRTEALFSYEKTAREMVHRFKFGRCKFTGKVLGDLLAKRISTYSPYRKAHFIIPVPIHFFREWKRGFNQAEILAERISKKLEIPILPALKRIKYTPPQSLLRQKERRTNLQGAFGLGVSTHLLRRKNIILVDDVFTTGSTLSECAKVLRKCGARRILVAVAAR